MLAAPDTPTTLKHFQKCYCIVQVIYDQVNGNTDIVSVQIFVQTI